MGGVYVTLNARFAKLTYKPVHALASFSGRIGQKGLEEGEGAHTGGAGERPRPHMGV